VLGIDLGIRKAVCTALVTPRKVSEVRYFKQKEKIASIRKYDDLVSKLQHKMHTRQNNGQSHDNLGKKLRQLKIKRANISREHDRVLVRQLIDYINQLSEKYTLYVAIGWLKGIRYNARKKNAKSRRFRRMIHSWAFARITESLRHQLTQLGWQVEGKNARFRAIPENWTSIICWKCCSKGRRPKQNLFICPNCGHKTNADRNGAINIASRFIMLTESLHSLKGLGKWAISVEAGRSKRLKARRKKTASKEKPSLSHHDSISSQRESAAVHHVQLDLLSFGDKSEMGDNDPAVVRTVETLTVSGSDKPTVRQEKESQVAGGTPSP
jgi:IS605 OrfB family transposase